MKEDFEVARRELELAIASLRDLWASTPTPDTHDPIFGTVLRLSSRSFAAGKALDAAWLGARNQQMRLKDRQAPSYIELIARVARLELAIREQWQGLEPVDRRRYGVMSYSKDQFDVHIYDLSGVWVPRSTLDQDRMYHVLDALPLTNRRFSIFDTSQIDEMASIFIPKIVSCAADLSCASKLFWVFGSPTMLSERLAFHAMSHRLITLCVSQHEAWGHIHRELGR